MAKQMNPRMDAYTQGYVPPKGSAGGEARGEYSYKSNPRSVPMKGSQIKSMGGFEPNADSQMVKRLEQEQRMKESLRGYGC